MGFYVQLAVPQLPAGATGSGAYKIESLEQRLGRAGRSRGLLHLTKRLQEKTRV